MTSLTWFFAIGKKERQDNTFEIVYSFNKGLNACTAIFQNTSRFAAAYGKSMFILLEQTQVAQGRAKNSSSHNFYLPQVDHALQRNQYEILVVFLQYGRN
jgi:hypothetical protein